MSDEILLSEILKSCCPFSFFNELLNLKQIEMTNSECILNYDLCKIESTVLDIRNYLQSLNETFKDVEEAHIVGKHTVKWFFEGRKEVVEVYRNLDSIDGIISQLLVILENKLVESPVEENTKLLATLEQFEEISDVSLKVKKFVIVYKKRVDILVQYEEIENSVIKEIDTVLNDCLQQSLKIMELKNKPVPKLDNLIELINQLSQLKQLIKPPYRGELYDLYMELREKLKPLEMSLAFVPHALENFKYTARDLYPELINDLVKKYDELQDKLTFLQKDIENLKLELVDSQWGKILDFIMTELVFLLNDIKSVDQDMKIDKLLNYKISVMDETLLVLSRMSNANLIKDHAIDEEYVRLTKNWNGLKNQLTHLEKDLSHLDDTEKLNILNSVKKDFTIYEHLPKFMKHADSESSPSKLNRKKVLGSSISDSLNLKPVYIESTPLKHRIDPVELDKVSSVTKKLLDIDSLTNEMDNLQIKGIDELIVKMKNSNYKSRIPVLRAGGQSMSRPVTGMGSRVELQSQRQSMASRADTQIQSVSRPITGNASRAETPSMIPRPISRSTSRPTSRLTSRIPSRDTVMRPQTSMAFGRLNLGNITNITNGRELHSAPEVRKQVPLRRPMSSMSNLNRNNW